MFFTQPTTCSCTAHTWNLPVFCPVNSIRWLCESTGQKTSKSTSVHWMWEGLPTYIMVIRVVEFSSGGVQNYKDFCLRINIPKGIFWILRIGLTGSLSSLQKSEFLKLIISFFHYFWCQNWDQWHKMSGKNTHIYFFYFWFKNKRVWAEKIGKKRKNSKNLKVAGNYPNI